MVLDPYYNGTITTSEAFNSGTFYSDNTSCMSKEEILKEIEELEEQEQIELLRRAKEKWCEILFIIKTFVLVINIHINFYMNRAPCIWLYI